ncbi:MAG TPA: AAA domain-containing protein, partial [Saprospiraceae bacterium]|nr:AAA domain-containing protein [Saprospiraceae bacterium]
MNEQYAPLLYREIVKIAEHPEWSPREQVLALASLLERLFFEATKQEQIAFSSLFARISYAGHQFHFQEDTLRAVHGFRLSARRVRAGQPAAPAQVWLGVRALAESVLLLTQAALPEELLRLLAAHPAPERQRATDEADVQWLRCVRVLALDDRPDEQMLIARAVDQPDQVIGIRYGLPERNAHFSSTIQIIRKVFGFPVSLNLLEVDVDAQGHYLPRAIVVEPDYLLDVSAVAECFKDSGPEPYSYLCRKFLPYEVAEPMLLGNIANFFLDRLLNEPDSDWKNLFLETFRAYPFVYAPMTDAQVLSVSGRAQKHYVNLKNMATGGFARQGIEPQDCVLEPTFFSEQYGLQGRLDLFYRTDEQAAIVELKSGTPYKPNSYGIQRSHFTQTLLYDLLVRSVFGHATDPAKYILYSGADLNHLRFAPTVAPEQWEALQVRNQLVAIERMLTKVQPGDEAVPAFGRLRADQAKGYSERDYALFEAAYAHLSSVEKKYFNAFTGFIAREHWLAKVGEENNDTLYGHANLWRSPLADKLQAFSILSGLELIENQADCPEPLLVFRRTAATHPLANFRVGDIAVLYPAADEGDTVLHHQVIKCTITELGSEQVTVQLRSRQFNLKPFDTELLWCLEPDSMDMGFASMYRSLFEWAGAEEGVRRRVMGIEGGMPLPGAAPASSSLLQHIISSPHFYLLWGPPGTGKTSVMLRDLAAWVMEQTGDNLLLLAYTNRAVDEICEALDSIGGDMQGQYIRIGNKHATSPRFRAQLLSTKIKDAKNRSELREVLEQHRIFVSTVASFSQNEGLLRIKKFQRLVVDEASQILEPQLV